MAMMFSFSEVAAVLYTTVWSVAWYQRVVVVEVEGYTSVYVP